MLTDQDLVKECRKSNAAAQKMLYYKYAPIMKGLCIRYCNNPEDTKDVLQEGFIKVFSNINSFSGKGSLEGWIKTIIINTALSHYRKTKKLIFEDINNIQDPSELDNEEEIENMEFDFKDLRIADLIESLQKLPQEFSLVFNLYYIENNSHKEIAKLLSIKERTSRTRLFRARKMLINHFNKFKKEIA